MPTGWSVTGVFPPGLALWAFRTFRAAIHDPPRFVLRRRGLALDPDDDDVEGPGDGARLDPADVHPLEHRHAGVLAKGPVELAAADVQRDDVGRAALEQAVREAPGRRPHVEGAPARHIDREGGERPV